MSKPTIYRAWDTYCKRFRVEFDWNIDPEFGYPVKLHNNGEESICQGEFGQLIVSEFTGIFDKNGRQIYDGDILGGPSRKVRLDGSLVANSEYESAPKQVIWMEDGWGYREKLAHLPEARNTKGLLIPAKYFEVKGNIFENPEMIVL